MSTVNNNENVNPTILSLFEEFQAIGGSPKVTEFKRYIDQQINAHVKPLCGRSSLASSSGSGWRAEQKARFGGRGMKWVKVSIDSILPTLYDFDARGVDTTEYRAWIESQGFAWIRYNGPRIHNGQPAAAFEVRTTGSTYDQPKELHYILDSELDTTEINYLHSTPHAMRLEVAVAPVKPKAEPEVQVVEEEVVEDIVTEGDEFESMDLDMDVNLD